MSIYKYLCKCDECPLQGLHKPIISCSDDYYTLYHYDCAANAVWFDNNTHKAMFVGMEPGNNEIDSGFPFWGQSGKLLKGTAYKLGYEDFYLSNVLLCKPIDDMLTADLKQAIKCCSPRLFAEIPTINPELVITVGAMPLEVLSGIDYPVMSVEGRILIKDTLIDYPILPIIHPAALLYGRESAFPDFKTSMEVGMDWISDTYYQAPIPECVIHNKTTLPELLQTLDNVNKAGDNVVIDLETTRGGLFPYGWNPDGIRCIALTYDGRVGHVIPCESSEHFEEHPNYIDFPGLKEVLSNTKMVGHNAPFDCGFLFQQDIRPTVVYDTLLAHYCTDEREEGVHGLKKLAQRHLGAPDWESNIHLHRPKKHDSYDLIPDDVLYNYAAGDVVYTWHLKEYLDPKVEKYGFFQDLLMPCLNMFNDLRHQGILVDPELIMQLDDIFDKEYDDLELEIARATDWLISNPKSAPEVCHYLYDVLKLPVDRKLGRTSSKKYLKNFSGNETIAKIIEARGLSKLKGTYVEGMGRFVDRNFRIHPFTKLWASVTGRISTEDPAVMNIVHRGRIREMYCADGEWAEIDNKQMELRCYAIIARDKKLRDLLMSDAKEDDPHYQIAVLAYSEAEAATKRTRAKSGVFGTLYGQSEDGLMRNYGIPRNEAKVIRKAIFEFLPTVPLNTKRVEREIHANGELTSFFGRKRRFGLLTDRVIHEYYRQGANFEVQSMASDVNLFAMLHVYHNLKHLGARPMFPVHDSITFDIADRSCIPELKKEIEEYCTNLVQERADFYMRFKTDVKIGPNWGQMTEWSEN